MNTIVSLQDLENFVFSFLEKYKPCRFYATIISLSGDLGVGKTAFVKACGKYFLIDEDITSPTFVIQKEYFIKNNIFFKKLIHIDAYRLQNAQELEYLGWNEIIKNPENIICIEWPEQVSGISLPGAINIELKIEKDNTRTINIK